MPAVLRRHGESGATGTVAASAAVDLDLRHQTLAVRPETACGFGGAYRVFSRLAECGSTTGQLCWSGAEGVQCCYAFDVKALKALPAATQQEGEAGRQRAGNRENAERKCGRRVSAARFSRRRRRAAFWRSRAGDPLPFRLFTQPPVFCKLSPA